MVFKEVVIHFLVFLLIASPVTASQNIEEVNSKEHYLDKRADSYDESAITTLNQFLIGGAAGKLTTCSKVTPSSNIFAAGGLINLTGEIGATYAARKDLNKELEQFIVNRDLDASQKEGAITLLNGFDEQISRLEERLQLIQASSLTCKAGAAVSYFEGAQKQAARSKILAGTQACIAGAPQEIALNPTSAQACQSCMQRAINTANQVLSDRNDLTDGQRGLSGFQDLFKNRNTQIERKKTTFLEKNRFLKKTKSLATMNSFLLSSEFEKSSTSSAMNRFIIGNSISQSKMSTRSKNNVLLTQVFGTPKCLG